MIFPLNDINDRDFLLLRQSGRFLLKYDDCDDGSAAVAQMVGNRIDDNALQSYQEDCSKSDIDIVPMDIEVINSKCDSN
jgi:hypothetical protein